jgi:LmbE family N-acetylglucosaminyl deacetylase/GT2 family glycosyltransferase
MSNSLPISVVIASYGKLDYLQACLESLKGTHFPVDRYEVVVVNDGSPDGTREFLDAYRPPYRLVTVHTKNQGLAAARNAGIAAASGSLLVMLDNDCVLDKDALGRLWHAHVEHPGRMCLSTIRHVSIGRVAEVIAQMREGDLSFVSDSGCLVAEDQEYALQRILRLIKVNLSRLVVGWFGAQGPSVAIEADAMRRIGGYDAAIRSYGMEDFDLAFRFTQAGGELHYVETSTIYHLDHGHDSLQLFSGTAASTQYFYRRHQKQFETPLFIDFLSERITYLEFNNAVARHQGKPVCEDKRLDIRFSVYGMIKHRDAQMQRQRATRPASSYGASQYCLNMLLASIREQLALAPTHADSVNQVSDPPGKRVLVLAPHMDDEVIGCGGLIQKYLATGAEVVVAFCTSGPGSPRNDHELHRSALTAQRLKESKVAARILGGCDTVYFHLTERQLAKQYPSSDKLYDLLRKNKFDVLYVPGPDEFHPDHRATWRWVQQVLPRLPEVPQLYAYEVWGNCRPDHLLVLDEVAWRNKQKAMKCYASQLTQLDYQQVMLTLAEERGRLAIEHPGAKAEGFRRVS